MDDTNHTNLSRQNKTSAGESPDAGRPSRRQVLAGAGAGLGAAAVISMSGPAARASAALAVAAAAPNARSLDFNQGWKFVLVNAEGTTDPTGAYASAPEPGFDDSSWQDVDTPHDWSIALTPVQASYTYFSNGFLPGGLGWYRKTFTLPRSLSGKRISIEFDGVYSNSYVYVNGQLLGNHPYAYTGFNYDLTGQVHTDGKTPNVIAVQATNPIPSSRWYSGSGIHRDVHLIVTSPVHVARHGTFVTTPGLATTIGSGYATVQAQTTIANYSATGALADVELTVTDPGGRTVARATIPAASVAAGAVQDVTAALRVTRPSLWSVDDPALYRLTTRVTVGGSVADTTTTVFGIRYVNFDPNDGVTLNGQYLKLQGVDLHAPQGPLGAAIRYDSLLRQMRLMKSMGVNALRTAHNPPAPQLVRVCQEIGVLMMVEAFDCWHTGKLPFDYHLYFDQWGDLDIKEMVNAHKNSPAVVLWSIGNETPDTGRPAGPGIAQRLKNDVLSIDTTRPVIMGSDQYRSVPRPGSPQDQIAQILDGMGINYNTAKSMDGLHAAYPARFFFESESSSETATRGVYQDPQLLNTGENYTPGKLATSSYDNNLASWTMSGEYALKKDRDRQFFQGQFLWAGQDYIGEPTPYTQFPVKSSFFGAHDTAGFAKDMYHLFKSQWTTQPMVHIVPMDWTGHAPGEDVAVWVYANVPTVELRLNGKSLGTKSFDRKVTTYGKAYLETTEPTGDDDTYPSGSYTSPNGSTGKLHLTWSVPFEPGTLEAVATAGGAVVARDQLTTAGPAAAIALSPDRTVLTADGNSLSFVTATIVDARGVTVPGADNLVTFAVNGPATIAGTDNGRQENASGYAVPVQAAFNGLVLGIVQATRNPGPIWLTATSPGLRPARVTLRAVPPDQPARGVGGLLAASTARSAARPATAAADPAPADPATPTADASYSGSPAEVPANMLDGNPGTSWSNFYVKAATANLPAVSVSHASEWVSLRWTRPQTIGTLNATFVTSSTLSLPAAVAVTYWNGTTFVQAGDQQVTLATASGQPSVITFDPVTTTQVRLELTSPAPGTSTGFFAVAELSAG
jgi:beta-galactosidase